MVRVLTGHFFCFASDINNDDRPLRRTLHRPVLWATADLVPTVPAGDLLINHFTCVKRGLLGSFQLFKIVFPQLLITTNCGCRCRFGIFARLTLK